MPRSGVIRPRSVAVLLLVCSGAAGCWVVADLGDERVRVYAPFDADAIGIDAFRAASDEAAAPVTSDGGEAPCSSEPFGPPSEVVELNVGSQPGGARLTSDQRHVVFSSRNPGPHSALFEATRDGPSGRFGAVRPIPGLTAFLATTYGLNPTISDDLLTIYFGSNKNGPTQVWYATRGDAAEPFGDPQPIKGVVDTSANTGSPFLAGSVLYVHSGQAPTQGGYDIFRTEVTAPGVGSGFSPVPELNTPQNDYAPVVSATGLVAYLSRHVLPTGRPAAEPRIWRATRSKLDAPFADLTPLTSVWSDAAEYVSWVSPDDCTIYIESHRTGAKRIYVAHRPR